MNLFQELGILYKLGQRHMPKHVWRDRMRKRIEQIQAERAKLPRPVPTQSEPEPEPIPVTQPEPEQPVVAPKPRPTRNKPSYNGISPSWKPKKGEKVIINTNAIPELLGKEALVVQVLAGGQRIIIRTLDAPIQEFKCKPTAVIHASLGIDIPHTGPIPNNNPNRTAISESSDPVINQALVMGRNVAFDYVDLHGNYTQRDVEPHYVFQARGTKNELLLTKDYKMRNGDWRCFRVEAMKNTSLGEKFSLNKEATYDEVDEGLKDRLYTMRDKYPDKSELMLHLAKDDLFTGLMGYHKQLKSELDHEVELPRHKHSMLQFEPNWIIKYKQG